MNHSRFDASESGSSALDESGRCLQSKQFAAFSPPRVTRAGSNKAPRQWLSLTDQLTDECATGALSERRGEGICGPSGLSVIASQQNFKTRQDPFFEGLARGPRTRYRSLDQSWLSTVVVHLICNQGVAGSNPAASTTFCLACCQVCRLFRWFQRLMLASYEPCVVHRVFA